MQFAPTAPKGKNRNNGRKNKLITKNMTYNPNINHRRSIRLKGYDNWQVKLDFVLVINVGANCIRPI